MPPPTAADVCRAVDALLSRLHGPGRPVSTGFQWPRSAGPCPLAAAVPPGWSAARQWADAECEMWTLTRGALP